MKKIEEELQTAKINFENMLNQCAERAMNEHKLNEYEIDIAVSALKYYMRRMKAYAVKKRMEGKK